MDLFLFVIVVVILSHLQNKQTNNNNDNNNGDNDKNNDNNNNNGIHGVGINLPWRIRKCVPVAKYNSFHVDGFTSCDHKNNISQWT